MHKIKSMAKRVEEVELSKTSKDDFEVIPITPIRRLEKRMKHHIKVPKYQQILIGGQCSS